MNPRAEPADRVLTLTRLINAPRSLVFPAWFEPAQLARWWGPHGFTLPHCEVDFRVGGGYRFCMRAPAGSDHWVWGTYEEIVPPSRLVFTWHRTETPSTVDPWAVSRVTVTFAEEAGKTRLTMHQAVFPRAWECLDHRGGWTESLDRLVAFAGQTALVGNFQPQPT